MYGNTGCFLKFIAPKTPQPILDSLLPMLKSREKRGLSAFSTSLAKKHGKRDFYQAISPFSLPCFCNNLENNEAFN
jgi:hypothetical protein